MNFFLDENNFKKLESSTELIYENVMNIDAKITIVIPTFKRVDYIVDTLNSLDSQSNKMFKVIIVDNNNDFKDSQLLEILKQYKKLDLKYYKNVNNLGMTGNWNRGIELCETEWISILHDDDYFEIECIEKIDNLITQNNVDMIIGKVIKGAGKIYKLSLLYIYLNGNLTPFPGVFFKKEKAIKLGGFNNDYFPGMDYIFWTRYIKNFSAILYDDKIANYRLMINESSKIELQEKYIELDYCLRKEISTKKWYSIFNNYLLEENISGMEKFRGSKLDIQRIYKNLGIKNFKKSMFMKFSLKIMRRFINLNHRVIKN